MNDDYLTVPELAKKLRVSERTAYRYVKQNRIPKLQVGGTIRVPASALEALVQPVKAS